MWNNLKLFGQFSNLKTHKSNELIEKFEHNRQPSTSNLLKNYNDKLVKRCSLLSTNSLQSLNENFNESLNINENNFKHSKNCFDSSNTIKDFACVTKRKLVRGRTVFRFKQRYNI